ncbi:chromatin-silencing transcriptional regulator TUP1 PWA37_004664 [Arxiozyma heterogenica]|uniref:chromatin-silencing transcriptional regulator TUP1 n=1 Tax=Arxiozyma heterogenica TaxID=278026 RepID=UPI002F033E90
MSQSKIDDLLESIRHEFVKVSQDANSYRLQNQKDFNFKVGQQLAEMQQIRSTVYELELAHKKMKDSYEEELSRMKLGLEEKDRQIQSLLIQQQQWQQKFQIQNISQNASQTFDGPIVALQQPDNRLSVASITSDIHMVVNSTADNATKAQTSIPITTTNVNASVAMPTNTVLHPANTPITHVGVNSLISQDNDDSSCGNNWQRPQSTIKSDDIKHNQNTNSNASNDSSTSISPSINVSQGLDTSAIETKEVIANFNVSTNTDYNNNTEASNALVTVSSQIETQNSDKNDNKHNNKNTNRILISNERSNNSKPIPNFLLDLNPVNTLEQWKKVTPEYYILYNPSLPRSIDVDLYMSFEHSSVVCCVKFSNDGKFLATGCNRTVQVYNLITGELACSLSDDKTLNTHLNQSTIILFNETINDSVKDNNSSDLYIRSVCFSPDGKMLATGAEDKLIRIWDLAEKKICMILKGHEQDIYSLDYFPSGDKLVSGSGDNTVKIWDLTTGQCSLTLSVEDGITTVAALPNTGKYIAAGSLDRSVCVWDSETGYLVERLDSKNEMNNGHRDSVYSVVFTKDGKRIVSGSLDKTVKLWSLAHLDNNNVINGTSHCEVTYVGHKDFVLSVTTSENDEYILSGSKDRGVIFWNSETGEPLLMLQGHKNSVISVTMANNHPIGGDYFLFATGSGDCKARVWKYQKILK